MFNFNWKSASQSVLIKAAGLVLAVLFLSLATLFLGYCFISVASTVKGSDARITDLSGQVGNHSTAIRWGGLYELTVEMDQKKTGKIYCLYPAWPDQLQPSRGDLIRVWPGNKPLVGAVPIDGWGWIMTGTLLVVGFILMEFAFLSLTIR